MEEIIKKLDETSHLILHRTPMEDIKKGITVITSGEGMYVYDQDGKRYLDLDAGVTRPVAIGHGRKEIAQAVYDQICKLGYYTPCGFATFPPMKLADLLAEIVPGPINKFTFECDGSEAVESAMKIAKHYHHARGDKERFKVISRRGAYHGINGMGIRALGTVNPMRHVMEPLAPGGVFAESPYCYRCTYGLTYPNCNMRCATDIGRIIEFENPEQVSIFIGEGVQQGFGAYAPPKEYWPIVRKICDQYGVLLVIDEVICGFGRTGKMFAFEHFNLKPDLITMAKCITSGYVPLGAVGCTDEVMKPIDSFVHLHTYGNHPVSCAAALKNIEILQKEKLVENSAEMGKYFLDGLRTLEHHPIVGEVRGLGLWTAIDFTADKKSRLPLPANRLTQMVASAKEKGYMIKFMGGAIEFAPPLIICREEIDATIAMMDQLIADVEKDMGL